MKKLQKGVRDILVVFALQVAWCKIIFFALFLLIGLECEPTSNITLSKFFLACVFAPVWEEIAFRYIPLTIAIRYFKKSFIQITIGSAIFFGYIHGSPINIMIQGVWGLLFSIVYIRNGLKWAIVSHFLWNFYCFIS